MPRVTKEEKFRRRLRIEQLLDQGVESSVRIAEILCAEGIQISDREVRSDIKAVGKEWHASLVELRHARQMRLVREAEEDSRKLLAEWERSKLDKQRRRSRKKQKAGKDAQEKQAETQAETVTEGRLADPRYLKIRADNRQFIADTLGLQQPKKVAPTSPDGEQPWQPIQFIQVTDDPPDADDPGPVPPAHADGSAGACTGPPDEGFGGGGL